MKFQCLNVPHIRFLLRRTHLPSGKLTVCYWKWLFIVDLPIKNGDFSIVFCMFTRGCTGGDISWVSLCLPLGNQTQGPVCHAQNDGHAAPIFIGRSRRNEQGIPIALVAWLQLSQPKDDLIQLVIISHIMSLMIYPSYIPNANANKKANSQVGEIPIQKPCHKITPCLASPPLEVPVLIGLQNWHAEHPSDATDALGTLGAEDTSEKHMKIYIYI